MEAIIQFLSHPALQGVGVLLAFITAIFSVFVHLHRVRAFRNSERTYDDNPIHNDQDRFPNVGSAAAYKPSRSPKSSHPYSRESGAARPGPAVASAPSRVTVNDGHAWHGSRNASGVLRYVAICLGIFAIGYFFWYLGNRADYFVYGATVACGLGLVVGIVVGLQYPEVGLFSFLIGGIVFVFCVPFLISFGAAGIFFGCGIAVFLLGGFFASNTKL